MTSLIARVLFSTSAVRCAPDVELFIDGQSVVVEAGTALIQACEKAGVEIPRFCYHERLAIAGNCRMCLVEVEKAAKPVASCAMPVAAGMKVFTNSPMVRKAREGVMEFLLANHPLDCPICDQGGECDLQDQSMRYGSDRGRFREFTGKRAVENKNLGPLVKTVMTRCIHCTRCVRFFNEVAGAPELGTTGRGNDMEIGTYVEAALSSEMSGNIIDLCPVGALTAKPHAYTYRPWELKKTESIDVMDAIGSNIRVDSRGVEVIRVLPRLNEEINEEWINDKTRFSCDGLNSQRLTDPLIRQGDKFTEVSWAQALELIAQKMSQLPGSKMAAVAGSLADAESMVALKDLLARFDCYNLRTDSQLGPNHGGLVHGVDFRSNYLFNGRILGVEEAECLLIVGSNPRHEAASLNTRIRKAFLHNNLHVAVIGSAMDAIFDYEHLGENIEALEFLLSTKAATSTFMQKFSTSKRPMIILGSGILEHESASRVYATLSKLLKKYPNLISTSDNWNGINLLHRHASQVAALDIGFSPRVNSPALSECAFIYLLGADNPSIASHFDHVDAFVVYQGHHGDVGAQYADVVLPGCAYTEKSATFVNTEGRAQMTRAAVSPPGQAREDWTIIRALSQLSTKTLPYDDIEALHERMAQISPTLVHYGDITSSSVAKEAITFLPNPVIPSLKAPRAAKPALSKPFVPIIDDFYMTNAISRASATMAKCSQLYSQPQGAVSTRASSSPSPPQ